MARDKSEDVIVMRERAIDVFERSDFSSFKSLKDFEEFYKFLIENVLANCREEGLSTQHAQTLAGLAIQLQKVKERSNAMAQLNRGINSYLKTGSTKLLSDLKNPRKNKLSFRDMIK